MSNLHDIHDTQVYSPTIPRSKDNSGFSQPTLLDRAKNREGGKVNGKLDPRVAAAKQRAQEAAARAKEATQQPIKSELDLEVNDKEFIQSAQSHPIELDKRLQKEPENNYPANLITGAGEDLQLSRIAEQALKMLGTGLKPHIVATALSVTPAYISQLMSDEKFAKAVTERKIVTLTRANEHDENLHAVEELALRKLKTSLEFTNKPMEVARIFNIVNNAKRRGAGNLEEVPQEGRATVTLTLPAAARAKLGLTIEVNDNNQVTTVGSQQLGAIDPKFLMQVYREGGNLVEGVSKRVEEINGNEKVVKDKLYAAGNKADELDGKVNISEIDLDDL